MPWCRKGECLREIVNVMGTASGRVGSHAGAGIVRPTPISARLRQAQGLYGPITSADKLHNTDQRVYLLKDGLARKCVAASRVSSR